MMYKYITVILIITLIILVLLFINTNFFKLKRLGYSNKEIEIITSKLKDPNIKYILNIKYNNKIVRIINDDKFNEDNLKRYITYYNNNLSIEIGTIITIVNDDIDKYLLKYNDIILDLVNSNYFIIENTKRYIDYHNDNEDLSNSDIISSVNSNIDYEFYTNIKKTDTNKGNLMLINKYYGLDKDYIPNDLVTIDNRYGDISKIKEEVYNQFKKMYEDASLEGIYLYINSAYRDYDYQEYLYNNFISINGKEAADTFSAKPGHSEHQTGLALDITTKGSNFDNFDETMEFKWLKNNAYKYGFILRYPEGKEYLTGYMYEPWHYRYVGIDIAKEIKDLDITYEEYYAYYIK